MALSKLAVRRLTKLADYMEKLPKSAAKHFDMGAWFSHRGDHDHAIGRWVERDTLNYCGTTACALGWAATVPAFRRAGLVVEAMQLASNHNENVACEFFDIDTGDKILL